jgi:hypothetical protein
MYFSLGECLIPRCHYGAGNNSFGRHSSSKSLRFMESELKKLPFRTVVAELGRGGTAPRRPPRAWNHISGPILQYKCVRGGPGNAEDPLSTITRLASHCQTLVGGGAKIIIISPFAFPLYREQQVLLLRCLSGMTPNEAT